MERETLLQSLDQIDLNLETLEEVLKPILENGLKGASQKLPIFERVKLNVTVVYAIDTLLFNYLNTNGIDAKEHQVFQELIRVRQYFSKIKEAEEKHIKPQQPKTTLNKQAAARVIQHNLAANHFIDNKKNKEELAEIERRKEELKKKILANQQRKKSTASPLSASATPLAASPAVTPPEAAQAAELLDSVAKDIEMEDAEGSEEGEIDEGPEMQHPLPPRPDIDSSPAQIQSEKRKHNDPQTNGHTNGQTNGQSAFQKSLAAAEKKARKKARKAAKNAG